MTFGGKLFYKFITNAATGSGYDDVFDAFSGLTFLFIHRISQLKLFFKNKKNPVNSFAKTGFKIFNHFKIKQTWSPDFRYTVLVFVKKQLLLLRQLYDDHKPRLLS